MTGVAIANTGEQLSVVVGQNLSTFLVTVGETPQSTSTPEGVDVLMVQTNNGGEIEIERGIVTRTDTMRTAIYLSMFGGADWWANLDETEADRQYTAETGALLDELPPSSANLKRIEDAVRRDLKWSGADTKVEAFIPSLGRVKIIIEIDPNNTTEFEENWSAIK